MDREQTKRLIRLVCSAYPNFKPNDLSDTVDAWHFLLQDYDFNLIQLTLKTYIQTSGSAFAPSVSELIAITRKPVELNRLSEGEAWALVRIAIRNGIYGADEEYEKLPADVKKAVGSASMIRQWAMTDSSEIDTVIASNFMRNFKTIQEREAERLAIPSELMALLGKNASLALEGN